MHNPEDSGWSSFPFPKPPVFFNKLISNIVSELGHKDSKVVLRSLTPQKLFLDTNGNKIDVTDKVTNLGNTFVTDAFRKSDDKPREDGCFHYLGVRC